NTIHDPTNRLGRLIRLVHDNDGLRVANNLLSGPPLRNESTGHVNLEQNLAKDLSRVFAYPATGNLRLETGTPEVVRKAVRVTGGSEDVDGRPHHEPADLGASELR